MTLKRKPVRKMPRAKGRQTVPKDNRAMLAAVREQLLAQDKAQIKHYKAQQKAKTDKAKKKGETKKGTTWRGSTQWRKRSIGPAGGAPVSKKTGKARKPKKKLYPKIYSKLFGKKPLTT
jgi:hypothetical protein